MEEGESPDAAVLREAWEETGLHELRIQRYLGSRNEVMPPGHVMVGETTKVFSRPDPDSFDWAQIRRGIRVRIERQAGDLTQVTYEEADQALNPQYMTYRITGWVPNHALTATVTRHFYSLAYDGPMTGRWEVETDNHRFTLFWAPLDALPEIISPQATWVEMLTTRAT